MKIIQVVNGKCAWITPFKTVAETIGKYPRGLIFVEAPDYVNELWGFKDVDDDGNLIVGDERFIKPVPDEGYFYDDETGKIYPNSEFSTVLKREQDKKQAENKILFAEFLSNHPLTWTDGKKYGVTMEDQTEIQLNISQYEIQVQAGIENPVLEWHAISEACTAWTIENLSALVLAISNHIYPWFRKMQEYKTQIYACTTIEDIRKIDISYKMDS